MLSAIGLKKSKRLSVRFLILDAGTDRIHVRLEPVQLRAAARLYHGVYGTLGGTYNCQFYISNRMGKTYWAKAKKTAIENSSTKRRFRIPGIASYQGINGLSAR